MDFFASQDKARRNTNLLLLYFALAVFCIIVAIYLAIAALFLYQQKRTAIPVAEILWNPPLLGAVACATLLIIVCGSLYKISLLRSGGERVAEMLGGKLIPADTRDFLQKRLLNIVEEMAIASGVPVPPVYLLENERGINAFAAGFAAEDAIIGITAGAIETLDRDELQGVVAHEFSHIMNGDMRLDLKLVGFLHGILLIALIGRSILRGSSRNRNSKNKGGTVILGLVLLLLGYIGVLFGKLIKSGVSRQREYLADASAVQFTRNPLGLAGALKKIGGLASGSLLENGRAEEISHMFFSNGLKESWVGAFSTHPPLADRIVRLDPTFDGTYTKSIRQHPAALETEIALSEERKSGETALKRAGTAALETLAADPQNITRNIGLPVQEHILFARSLLASLPHQLREAATSPFGARAVIYGLLLDNDGEVRGRQMKWLKQSADKAVFEATDKMLPLFLALTRESRLPLMDLAMPSLRSMSLAQFRQFESNINALVNVDRKISRFELVLEHVITRRLEKSFVSGQGNVRAIDSIVEVAGEISCILSLLANMGHDDSSSPQAFADAAATFPEREAALHYMNKEECRDVKLDRVLNRLAQLTPKIKRSLISASFQCLVHDRQISMKEAEFFRLLAYSLETPLSPWVKI
jgi:Zn-dependent protease with chaperone function